MNLAKKLIKKPELALPESPKYVREAHDYVKKRSSAMSPEDFLELSTIYEAA
jgi:hypothetical protein